MPKNQGSSPYLQIGSTMYRRSINEWWSCISSFSFSPSLPTFLFLSIERERGKKNTVIQVPTFVCVGASQVMEQFSGVSFPLSLS